MTERNRADIGIIGALDAEVSRLIENLEDSLTERVGGVDFHLGTLSGKRVVIARCGVGKVFASLTAEAMIIKYSPRLLVNTGVGGAISGGIAQCDMVFADRLVQHDMDTSPLGDPKGLISGINKVFFDADPHAVSVLKCEAESMGVGYRIGTVASGDVFVAEQSTKERIAADFGAIACEMEGAAIAQVAFVNDTPFAVVRAISDCADGDAALDYPAFLPIAAERSYSLTLALIQSY